MNRLDDMNSWRMFCEIVRAEGLNAACERLDCEPSTASRAIHALEKELGAPLFSRSSRPVKLTQLGHEAYQAALKLTATHEDMIRSLKGDKSKLSGLIRVTSHAGIGPAEITPALVEFQKIYPDIQFELSELTAPLPDGFMTSDGNLVDVAVGYGEDAPLPGVIQRYSGEMPFIPCASPAYVKKHGFPRQVDDWQRHTGVLINTPTRSATTVLQKGAKTATIRWKSTLIVHNLISVKSAVIWEPVLFRTSRFITAQMILKRGILSQYWMAGGGNLSPALSTRGKSLTKNGEFRFLLTGSRITRNGR